MCKQIDAYVQVGSILEPLLHWHRQDQQCLLHYHIHHVTLQGHVHVGSLINTCTLMC